jgi:hypothetical protein
MTLGKEEKKITENTVPTQNASPKVKDEKHSHPTFLSNFILGSQDGLVNILGILLGLTAATTDVRIFFVAALAALGAESISMGAVAYTSTAARRQVYLKETNRESQEMKDVPENEKEEVKQIFRRWGYEGNELEDLTERIVKNPKATLDLMMSSELHLAPVGKSEARQQCVHCVVFHHIWVFNSAGTISFHWKKYSLRNRSFSDLQWGCLILRRGIRSEDHSGFSMEERLEDDRNRADCRSRRILDRSLHRCFTPVNVENRPKSKLAVMHLF